MPQRLVQSHQSPFPFQRRMITPSTGMLLISTVLLSISLEINLIKYGRRLPADRLIQHWDHNTLRVQVNHEVEQPDTNAYFTLVPRQLLMNFLKVSHSITGPSVCPKQRNNEKQPWQTSGHNPLPSPVQGKHPRVNTVLMQNLTQFDHNNSIVGYLAVLEDLTSDVNKDVDDLLAHFTRTTVPGPAMRFGTLVQFLYPFGKLTHRVATP